MLAQATHRRERMGCVRRCLEARCRLLALTGNRMPSRNCAGVMGMQLLDMGHGRAPMISGSRTIGGKNSFAFMMVILGARTTFLFKNALCARQRSG